jgi:hypothetical protein
MSFHSRGCPCGGRRPAHPIEEADPLAGWVLAATAVATSSCPSPGSCQAVIDIRQLVRRYAADNVLTGLAHLRRKSSTPRMTWLWGRMGSCTPWSRVRTGGHPADEPGPGCGRSAAAASATVPVVVALRPTWTVIPTGADGLAVARDLAPVLTFLRRALPRAAPLLRRILQSFLGLDPAWTPRTCQGLGFGCRMLCGCQLLVLTSSSPARVASTILIEFVTDDGALPAQAVLRERSGDAARVALPLHSAGDRRDVQGDGDAGVCSVRRWSLEVGGRLEGCWLRLLDARHKTQVSSGKRPAISNADLTPCHSEDEA